MKAIIIGATGLVGGQFLKYAELSSAINSITTITRRTITGSEKLNSIVKASTEEWPQEISKSDADIFFSAFGTTRADAGSIENFKKIDYGTNLESAKAAKRANIKTFVLISTLGASSKSYFPYLQIKGELEDEILALGFQRTVILRPGPLIGARTTSHKGWGNSLGANLSEMARGTIFNSLLNGVYAEELGKVGVLLATKPHGSEKETHVLNAAEIVELAKEWQ